MSYVLLARQSSVHRQLDGSTSIDAGDGQRLCFGPGFAPILDELRSGIQATEWRMRLDKDPMAARVDLALNEHRLLEHATSALRRIPETAPRSGPTFAQATWRRQCASTLFGGSAAAVVTAHLVPVNSLQPLPWWAWSVLPFVLSAMALLHETGHYLVARLHGQNARILMFHKGRPQARCVVAGGLRSRTATETLRILAAGPLTDGALLVASAAIARHFALHPLATVTMFCALAALLLNLMPGKRSDFARMLALAARDRPASAAMGWFVVIMLSGLAVAYLAMLTGLAQH